MCFTMITGGSLKYNREAEGSPVLMLLNSGPGKRWEISTSDGVSALRGRSRGPRDDGRRSGALSGLRLPGIGFNG